MTTQKIKDKIAEMMAMERAATPMGSAWIPKPTGMAPERMRSMGIIGNHNRTEYMGVHDAELIAESRKMLKPLLATLSDLVEMVGKVIYAPGECVCSKVNYECQPCWLKRKAQEALDRAAERFGIIEKGEIT